MLINYLSLCLLFFSLIWYPFLTFYTPTRTSNLLLNLLSIMYAHLRSIANSPSIVLYSHTAHSMQPPSALCLTLTTWHHIMSYHTISFFLLCNRNFWWMCTSPHPWPPQPLNLSYQLYVYMCTYVQPGTAWEVTGVPDRLELFSVGVQSSSALVTVTVTSLDNSNQDIYIKVQHNIWYRVVMACDDMTWHDMTRDEIAICGVREEWSEVG